jgi:hypothetical protein
LWLAKTSQQPISQTTWLKVTPHCNHYTSRLSHAGQTCNLIVKHVTSALHPLTHTYTHTHTHTHTQTHQHTHKFV